MIFCVCFLLHQWQIESTEVSLFKSWFHQHAKQLMANQWHTEMTNKLSENLLIMTPAQNGLLDSVGWSSGGLESPLPPPLPSAACTEAMDKKRGHGQGFLMPHWSPSAILAPWVHQQPAWFTANFRYVQVNRGTTLVYTHTRIRRISKPCVYSVAWAAHSSAIAKGLATVPGY